MLDYERIKLEDVGFIRRGHFNLLFSAGCPLGERRLGIDVPLTFEELDVGVPVFCQHRPPGCLGTDTVREIETDLGASAAATPYVQFFGSYPSPLKRLPGPLNLVPAFLTGSPGNAVRHW